MLSNRSIFPGPSEQAAVKSTRKRTIGFMDGKDTAMRPEPVPRDAQAVAFEVDSGYRYTQSNTATRQHKLRRNMTKRGGLRSLLAWVFILTSATGACVAAAADAGKTVLVFG